MKSTSTQDGAFAWFLCTMSFMNHVIIGGFVYASGMFYLMFKNSLDVSDGEAALITSINIGVMFSVGPIVGLLCDRFGSRCVAVASAAISTIGLAGSAFSTQTFHLYVSYGIIAGAGQGVINVINTPVLDPYFHKYKRSACSIALTGYGFGSFIIPPVMKFLEDVYGWRGAILLLAGINVHMMVTCSMFRPFGDGPQQKKSVPPQETVGLDNRKQASIRVTYPEPTSNAGGTIKSKGLEVLSLFRGTPFVCLCVYVIMMVFTQSIIATHFGSYLITLKYTSEDVVKLYMILGVGATITRPISGVVAEVTHANSATCIVLSTIFNGVLTMFVPLMNNLWMMYVYAVMYQLLMGPYLALGASTIMEHVPKSQVATAYGIYYFFCAPGFTLGAPIGAWLYDYTRVYAHSFYLAGSLMILSGLMMVPAAFYIHRNRE